MGQALSADARIIAVLYPDTIQPYRAVFDEIISGTQQYSSLTEVRSYAVTENPDARALRLWLESQAASAVITLGRVASQAYEATGLTLPQIVGALDASPQTRPEITGVSLSVDPTLLFATLKRLAPRTKRVFVVFNPAHDRWIIDRARQVAVGFDLALTPLEASDLRTAAQSFLHILHEANLDTDAIWLLAGSQIVDPEAILPVLIEQSWYRRLVVFSNNLAHVNLGVLFALFPDNQALGRRLTEIALRVAEDPRAKLGIEPLRDVKRALNVRMARRLGLTIDKETERQFDLVVRQSSIDG
jgi:putative ABC transport system substrate-binding protein